MGAVNFNYKKGDLETISQGGVYGIFVDNKPIYIGYTGRSFRQRFEEHKNFILHPEEGNLSFYNEMTSYERNNYKFKILFDVSKIKYARKRNGYFNRHELKCIECAFIYCFKPKYNESGNAEPYYFN